VTKPKRRTKDFLYHHLISFAITALYNKGQYLFFKRKPDLVISITQITNDLSGMFFISAENEFAVDLLTVALA